ncbi:MAG TPA: Uma2 family endonuclease [Bryobacteraceae bacterium]|nr:Uma2 family endonuclease [Bryobacteraceae bacterium]
MATSTDQITWQAFEQLPDGDGFHREVVEGELIVLPPAKSRHARIIKAVAKALAPLEDGGPWSVFVEAGYRLSENPPTWIQPDVSVLSSERARATSGDDYFLKPPELAVEVISPSETARDLTRKVDLLLAGGSLAVWVIYPENREVRVFVPDGTSYTRRGDQMLTLPELLPGWELPVAKLFED